MILNKLKSAFLMLLQKILSLKNALICFFGIAVFFIASDALESKVGKFLRVDPTFAGGDIALKFSDFSEASDFSLYSVYKPVTNARWQKNADYWQLVFDYKKAQDFSKKIKIYIDLDNIENESFESEKSYDFLVLLNGENGKVYNHNGEFICDTESYVLNENTRLKIRIPLITKQLLKVLGAKNTKHKIIVDDLGFFVEANLK